MIFNINSTRGYTGSLLVGLLLLHPHVGIPYGLIFLRNLSFDGILCLRDDRNATIVFISSQSVAVVNKYGLRHA